MGIKFSNLASTTLASGVSSSTTSISVTSATSFPTLGSGDYFYASIGIGSASEVVKVTSISGTTFTAVRGQDSTTAISHSSGAEIALRVVAATLEDLRDATDNDTTYSAGTGVSLSGTTFSLTDTNSKLNLSGGTLTGTLAMGANAITSTGTISSGAITATADIKANDSRVRIGNPSNLSGRSGIRIDTTGASPADLLFGDNTSSTSWANVNWGLSSRATNENQVFRIYRGSGQPSPYNSEAVALEIARDLSATFAGTISSGAITATTQTLVSSSGTSLVQSIRNPSTSWSQFALTRYGSEGANFRYMDFGYYRGTSEATRGLVIKSQANATKFTFLDSGDFQIGTTTVIDASRNLTNIGTISSGAISIDNGSQRVKYGVWSGTTYGVGMGTGYTYGAINNDYVMSFQMNDDSDRGFWWGDTGHGNDQGAMALSTDGYLTVASGLRLGFGESDTTHPSAGLQVNGTITSTGNSSHGGYASWTAGNGTAGIFMHYNSGNSHRSYFDWRTLQLGNNGANNILFGNSATGGYAKFFVNSSSISQLGGTSGIHAFSMLASGEVVKEANERFTIKSHSNGWAGGMRMVSSNGGTTFQMHPDDNGWMYVDNIWNFTGDIKINGDTVIGSNRALNNISNAYITNGGALHNYTSSGSLRGYIQAVETGGGTAAGLVIATSGGETISFKDGGLSGTLNAEITGGGDLNLITGTLDINGTTVIDASRQIFAKTGTQVGEDGTYGGYGVLGFGGITNGYNRVFGDDGTADGLYLASATGRGVYVRPNGASANAFIFSSAGEFQVGGTTVIDASANIRAPIFYDSNNTSYYVDPASTGLAAVLNGNLEVYARSAAWAEGVRVRSTSGWAGFRLTRDRSNYDGNWALGFMGGDTTDDFVFTANSAGSQIDNVLRLSNDNYVSAAGSMRAPIFYDSNNTGFYFDGSSSTTSVRINGDVLIDQQYGRGVVGVYHSTVLQHVWAMGGAYRLAANGSTSGNLYGMAWSHPNAGTKGGANHLNDHGLLIINNGSFQAAISSRAVFSADVRGTQFYDYNDTSYYVDPASTSISGKFRQTVIVGDGSQLNSNDGSWGARLNLTDSVHSKIEIGQDANSVRSYWWVHTGHDKAYFGTSTNHHLEFQTSGTTRLKIDKDGGTTNTGDLNVTGDVQSNRYDDVGGTFLFKKVQALEEHGT